MSMNDSLSRVALFGLACSIAPVSSWACASCGCVLSADAATGYAAAAGWRLGVEYDYVHQDQLRSGTRAAYGVPDGNELERETLNRYATFGLSYSPNSSWTIDLRVPYVRRTHTTYGEFDSTQALPDISGSRSASWGDIKLIGSYQGLLPTHNLGLQLGVKLPTGHYGTMVNFSSGPNADTPLDASLQPGTGSTDLIVGAYYFQAISQTLDIIANAQFQDVVRHRQDQPGNDFSPGNATTLNVGLRYAGNARWVPQLQVNWLRKQADQGALADAPNTAGTVAYLSQGVTVRVLNKLQVFGFLQLPVYSKLDGYQLFPRWTVSVGASYAF
jgi:hypothetical protein